MALTMTRTRNQTTLTKLAELVANVHGELAFVEARLAEGPAAMAGALRVGLERRRGELLASRAALYQTVRQFDPAVDPRSIRTAEAWLKPFGRGQAARRRYCTEHAIPCGP
jgi:hypothetical protein